MVTNTFFFKPVAFADRCHNRRDGVLARDDFYFEFTTKPNISILNTGIYNS